AEEVVGLIVDADESAGQSTKAAGQADTVLTFLLYLQREIDGVVDRVLLGLGIGLRLQRLEILQLIQPQQAQFPEPAVVNATFFHGKFAADDLIARGGVAAELDAADEKWLAFVNVDVQRDEFLLLVDLGVRNRGEVDVAEFAVGFANIFQSLTNESGIENVAILHWKESAQDLGVGNSLVVLEGDGLELVSIAFLNGD